MAKENKFCSLCIKEINPGTKYNVFKHNTLFKDGPGFWSCLMRHYVCEDCFKKLQQYCQEEGIDGKRIPSNNN